jgi:hypothetical protein
MSIQDYLPNDNYKPKISKPSLQQWDNYQIYDLFCTEIKYGLIPQNTRASLTTPDIQIESKILAVEQYNPNIICVDFRGIASQYF